MDYHRIIEIVGADLTANQRATLEAVIETDGNVSKASRNLGVCRASVRQSLKQSAKKAANLGYAPKHDMTKTTVSPFRVKGTSTLYGEDGGLKIQWVKTERDKAAFLQEVADTIHEITDDLPVLPEIPVVDPNHINQMTHAVYPLGDPHIGMLSWGEETGEDWDLAIAERVYASVWAELVRSAPRCAECTIVDLGDFWHSDNYEQTTARSGQKVDQDGRYAKMIKVGYRIMMQMIVLALEHHEIVNVVILPGNHDDVGSLFLRESLTHIFAANPRVRVNPSVSVFQYLQWGKTLVGFHHGHTCKMKDLAGVMAADHRSWSECTHRYWYTGHIHHDSVIELQGCRAESFRVIPPNEAYAHERGYRAGRDSKCVILHRERGEISRFTRDIEYVEI